jgi:hypothetical protein
MCFYYVFTMFYCVLGLSWDTPRAEWWIDVALGVCLPAAAPAALVVAALTSCVQSNTSGGGYFCYCFGPRIFGMAILLGSCVALGVVYGLWYEVSAPLARSTNIPHGLLTSTLDRFAFLPCC